MNKENIQGTIATIAGATLGRTLASSVTIGERWIHYMTHSQNPLSMGEEYLLNGVKNLVKPFAGYDVKNIAPIKDLNPNSFDLLRVVGWVGSVAAADLVAGQLSRIVATNKLVPERIREYERAHSSYLTENMSAQQKLSRSLIGVAYGTVLYDAILGGCSNGDCGYSYR